MTPTIEEVNKAAIKCGATNSILLDPIATLQLGKYLAFDPAQLQAFAHHWIEVGRKNQREKDAKLIEPKNDKSDWTSEAEYADFLARMIRNNTGE